MYRIYRESKDDKLIFKSKKDEDDITIKAYLNDDYVGKLDLEVCFSYFYYFEEYFTEEEYDEIFNEQFLKIDMVEVEPIYRGSGFAKQLMNYAIKKAKQLKLKQIYLNASPIQYHQGLNLEDLIKFYEKFGFKTILHQGNNAQMLLNLI